MAYSEKNIQLLRNSKVYKDLATAKSSIETYIKNTESPELLDGVPILGRYNNGEQVSTLLGLVHHSGDTANITYVEPTSIDEKISGLTVSVSTGETTSGYLKTYEIKQNNSVVGKIDIPKDFLVTSGSVVTGTWKSATEFIPSQDGKDKALALVLNVKKGQEETSIVYIDIKDLCKTYTAGNGLELSSSNTFDIKVSDKSEKYLAVGEDGIKLSGITSALNEYLPLSGATIPFNTIPDYGGMIFDSSNIIIQGTFATPQEHYYYFGMNGLELSGGTTSEAGETLNQEIKANYSGITFSSVELDGERVVNTKNATIVSDLYGFYLQRNGSGLTISHDGVTMDGDIKITYDDKIVVLQDLLKTFSVNAGKY